jgi:hypothetical protein
VRYVYGRCGTGKKIHIVALMETGEDGTFVGHSFCGSSSQFHNTGKPKKTMLCKRCLRSYMSRMDRAHQVTLEEACGD